MQLQICLETKNKMKKRINLKILILCFAIVYLVAFIGGIFTSISVNSEWYESIKSSITPPDEIFPIVWNILFFLISISLFLVWTNSSKKEKRKIGYVFGINLFLNLLWSFLFFFLRNPTLAFVDLIFLELSIFSMIFVSWKIKKTSAILLIPYLLWVTFAGILNYSIVF